MKFFQTFTTEHLKHFKHFQKMNNLFIVNFFESEGCSFLTFFSADSSTSKTDRPTDVSDFSISRRSAKERRSVKESPKSSVKQR